MKVFQPLKHKEHNYKKVMGFDIETKGENNDFVLATFYSDDIKQTCYSKEEVVNFINHHTLRNYNIFATNLGFDFLGTLYEHSERWSVLERNGCIYSFKWYQQMVDGKLKRPVTFYDTMRILPFSVEKLGKLLKIPKMEHPTCFGKQPKNEKEYKELKEYCMNDSKISYEFIKQIVIPFLQKYKLKFKSTIGSISLDEFRTNHLDIPLFQEPELNREIAFKSYYGGRTETYQRGFFENVYCFDINSLYPSVMTKPIPNPNKSNHHDKGSLYNIKTKEGVSEVLVRVPKHMKIPPLPYKKDGKLIFPVGTFQGYYNHNELRNAIKYGVEILEVYEQLTYKETKRFFKSFIEEHYAERRKLQKENNPLEVMEKNVMNNLYGKFAFNYKKSSSLIPEHDFDFKKHVENASYIEPMCNNKFISVEEVNAKPPIYSFPIISSYITSYARIKMYKYLNNPMIQDRIISTDTDSIFMYDYKDEIETSTLLGDMKIEDGYPIKDAIFIRPKMYKTFKPKCKGVKFNDAKSEFKAILDKQPITQKRFTKYRTVIRSQTHHKYGVLQPNQIIQVEKKLDLEDTKRNWIDPFTYTKKQDSYPLEIDYKEEIALKEQEIALKLCKVKGFENTLYNNNLYNLAGEDGLDAKGEDITDKEFIENEMFFALNE